MCYSAQIVANWREFFRRTGIRLSLEEFHQLFWARLADPRIRIPKALEDAFLAPGDDEAGTHEREIRDFIAQHRAQQAGALEQELFKQRKRLADAERALQTRSTKTALENRRIAGEKVQWVLGKLADLRRSEPQARDARIFPGWYVPVVVSDGGQRIVKPMRYQCRPAGKPAFYDTRFPGTYNARRDNLEGFWKPLFGRTHGLMVVERFYENVTRTRPDGTSENVVLEFAPAGGQPMWVACLWSRWTAPGEPPLLSCAAITDEPPPEVAAAGHDRCIVPLRPEHAEAWLNPDPRQLAAQYAILDDRERPYYEHRLAA